MYRPTINPCLALAWQADRDTCCDNRTGRREGQRMTEQEAGKVILSPQQLEQLWGEHLKGEFETKNVEATLATMVDDASDSEEDCPRCRSGRAVSRRQTCLRADLLGSRGRPSTIGPAQGVVTSHIGWVEQSNTHQI